MHFESLSLAYIIVFEGQESERVRDRESRMVRDERVMKAEEYSTCTTRCT